METKYLHCPYCGSLLFRFELVGRTLVCSYCYQKTRIGLFHTLMLLLRKGNKNV